jgi:hypothetical protein
MGEAYGAAVGAVDAARLVFGGGRGGGGVEVDGDLLRGERSLTDFSFAGFTCSGFPTGVFPIELFEEQLCGAFGLIGMEFGGRCEETVLGVLGDFGDDLGAFFTGAGFWQVEAGDLEAVEEQAGAAGVDFVGGDAAEDFSDGLLDGRSVLGVGEVEAGLAALAGVCMLDGAAGVVVEVAETVGAFGAADGWAAAAAAVGEDVAALKLLGLGRDELWCHMSDPLPGVFAQNLEMIWVSGGP